MRRCARCGRWWDREYTDETNDPTDLYDKGAPDYKADYPDEVRRVMGCQGKPTRGMGTYQKPKDLKWRIVCAGVQRLIEQQGLDEAEVMLWFDWQSSALHGSSKPPKRNDASPLLTFLPAPAAVYQDDKVKKLEGVKSLIQWATMCQYMLVPTEGEEIRADFPQRLPGYGRRGWW